MRQLNTFSIMKKRQDLKTAIDPTFLKPKLDSTFDHTFPEPRGGSCCDKL